MKRTSKQREVFKKEFAEAFVYGKNTMSVLNIDEFKRHRGSAFHRVFVAAGRTKSAMVSKRDKLKVITVGTAIHGTAKRRIPAIDYLIDIFHFRLY